MKVSVLFSEPKIPQLVGSFPSVYRRNVSVLFSEPKIPQCICAAAEWIGVKGFSALQRAENSSTSAAVCRCSRRRVSVLFSEPKIPQSQLVHRNAPVLGGFSALQRAENSSITLVMPIVLIPTEFQCSSASRKFLKSSGASSTTLLTRFSALQRAENSSIGKGVKKLTLRNKFQCSSASRKFLNPTLAPASIHISDRDDHASSFLSLPGASP